LRARALGLQIGSQAAIDSTGFETGHASLYYSRRKGIVKSHYPKLTAVCDTATHLYLAAVVDTGPMPDFVEFQSALLLALRLAHPAQLLADAGYDSEANHAFCHETLGIQSIIPPRHGRQALDPAHLPATPYPLFAGQPTWGRL
jgi:hypothetical protein